ncbi:MAG: FAD-dependent oxidoreductase [Verrucomicrobia bacterium]|nr:FAD-dependent oxidoreductase [Verrucomicrobiota bacterium]
MPAEVLDAKQTAALDPGVTMSVAGSVFFSKDCHLSPGRFLAAMEQELQNSGVKFIWGAEVTGFEKESDRITAVKTTQGDIASDEFVLASGVWSDEMSRELKLALPMQAGKGYSLTVTQPRQLPELCSICTEARIAVTPMDGTLRFGGTMEIAGINETINSRRVRGIVRAVPDYFPEFKESDFTDIKPWSGLRPCSPDGMPYIGRTKKWKNLTVATGHAMMGLSLGPVTGRLVAELLAGEKPSVALPLLSPDRFA